jgi:phage tail-like protein
VNANGTTFYLLLGEDDWGSCTDDAGHLLSEAWDSQSKEGNDAGLDWDRERNELTLRSKLFQFIASPKDNPPSLAERRGAGRDRYGNWYWIDQTGREILVNSYGSRATSHLWASTDVSKCRPRTRPGDFRPREPEQLPASLQLSGLSITEDHYLVVGVLEPAGVLIFDLHAGGEPRQLRWPEGAPFVPFDMSPRPGGGVWILDRENRCYWALDRHFQIVRAGQQATGAPPPDAVFQPQGESSAPRKDGRLHPAAITPDAASAIALIDPIAIEALPDGTVLLLDHQPHPYVPFSLIYHYYYDQQLGPPVSTAVMSELIEEEGEEEFSLVAHDFAFVPEHDALADRLYVVAANGNQTFAFHLSEQHGELRLFPLADFLPMRLFGGKGLVAAGTQPFYDFGDGWVPLIEQKRPRYVPQATFLTPRGEARPAFDGKEPDCVWHRLMIDACIPNEASVRVWSRAANDERDLAHAEWQPEPSLYLRDNGSELPFAWQTSFRDGAQAAGHTSREDGTWELLFQRARGRYLQLKIRLEGNGRTTPRLRALRAYYPRFSYLTNYMPAVYREDEQSASFLDRFLANIEGFYTTIEDKIAAVQVMFDIYGAPPETLSWLAGWFGMALDPAWNAGKRRLFIKHAMDFFQYRGTMRGMLMALRLAFEDCADETLFTEFPSSSSRPSAIRLVEKFRTRRTPGVVLGDPTSVDGPRQVLQTERWLPANGVDDLHRRYRVALGLSDSETYPITDPGGEKSVLWQQFSKETLGFIPTSTTDERRAWQLFLAAQYPDIQTLNADFAANATDFAEISLPDDVPASGEPLDNWNAYLKATGTKASSINRRLWQDYLARRYQRVAAFNTTYGTSWPAFESVSLPDAVPGDGAPLQDWYTFEAVVLAMRRTAHRFTVMLPILKSETVGSAAQRRQVELTRRIVNLEKPAHTIFDVKFYWAMFRTGEARLGFDTLIDYGSRAPQLMPPMVLGEGYLAGAYLAPGHPQDATDRQILGC